MATPYAATVAATYQTPTTSSRAYVTTESSELRPPTIANLMNWRTSDGSFLSLQRESVAVVPDGPCLGCWVVSRGGYHDAAATPYLQERPAEYEEENSSRHVSFWVVTTRLSTSALWHAGFHLLPRR